MKAIALTLAALASICAVRADDWPVVRHDTLNTAYTASTLKPPLKRAWTKAGATSEPIIVAGTTVLYTAKKGKAGLRDLVAVNASTGKTLWSVPNVAQTGAASAALGMAFTIIRTTQNPTSVSRYGANLWPAAIVGLDLKTGKKRWMFDIGDHPTYPAVSPLTVAGNVLYMVNIPYCLPGDPCPGGSLIALNTKDGSEVGQYTWQTIFNGQIGLVDGPPIIDTKNRVITVALGYNKAPQTPGGQVWLFNADKISDGPVAKLGDPGPKGDAAGGHSFGDAWPMMAGDALAIQGPRQDVQSWWMTGTAATPMWETRFDKDKAHSLLRGGKFPIVLEYNGGIRTLTAIRADVAKVAWTRVLPTTGLTATTGSVVYVPAEAKDGLGGVLAALDAGTGKTMWTTSSPYRFNAPVPAGGRLFVIDGGGTLSCYVPGTPAPAPKARARRK